MLNGAAIATINYQIVEDIKRELRLQGHYLTGELEGSFQEKQTLTEFDVALEAYAYAFIDELEKGVQAQDIPAFNKNSQEFQSLVKWVQLRGLEHAGRHFMSADSIAEAIWRKWQKKGKPLESSKQFSKTGEITGAIESVFTRKDDDYFKSIDEEVVLEIDKIFTNDN